MRIILILCFFVLKIISANAQCSITLSYTPASCPTCCDGCIAVNIVSPCPPYTISWYPSDPTFPVCSVCEDTTYIASMTDACGCTTSDTITPTGTTGIGSSEINNIFAIYPNPSSELLILKTGLTNELLYVSISDISGNIVLKTDLKSAENKIHTNQLTAGIYFITIHNDIQIFLTEKWIKAQ